jgi:hypothetical protein
MKPNLLLTMSAIYVALTGLGMLLVPQTLIVSGSAGTPTAALFALRGYGGLLLGVAVINWIARNADASKSKDAIFLGNTVAYALSAIVFLVDVLSGGVALVWVYVIISTLFTIAFLVVGRANRSSSGK